MAADSSCTAATGAPVEGSSGVSIVAALFKVLTARHHGQVLVI